MRSTVMLAFAVLIFLLPNSDGRDNNLPSLVSDHSLLVDLPERENSVPPSAETDNTNQQQHQQYYQNYLGSERYHGYQGRYGQQDSGEMRFRPGSYQPLHHEGTHRYHHHIQQQQQQQNDGRVGLQEGMASIDAERGSHDDNIVQHRTTTQQTQIERNVKRKCYGCAEVICRCPQC